MKCMDVRRQLFPFLDNELGVQENLEILTHLDLCSGCSGYFESEKRFEDLITDKLKADSPEENASWPAVQTKVREFAYQEQHRARLRRRALIWGPALAAGFTVASVFLYYLAWPAKLNAESLVNQSVKIHRDLMDGNLPQRIPVTVRNDIHKLQKYLVHKTGIHTCGHNLSKLGYAPMDGCLAHVHESPRMQAPMLVYHKGAHVISHMVLRDPKITFPRGAFKTVKGTPHHYYLFAVKPYKIIILRNGRTLCMFVGSLNGNQISELVETALAARDA